MGNENASLHGWDRVAFVNSLRERVAVLEPLLCEGDAFDYERFRFFSAQDLNGGNETAVIVPLTKDSPSERARFDLVGTVPWTQIAPLPFVAFLPLDNTNCFGQVVNGVPYLQRCIDWNRVEFVNEHGDHVRDATSCYWERGSNKPEKLWFTGGAPESPAGEPHGLGYHAPTCCTVTTNET